MNLNIKCYRKEFGLSVKHYAKILGVSPRSLERYEYEYECPDSVAHTALLLSQDYVLWKMIYKDSTITDIKHYIKHICYILCITNKDPWENDQELEDFLDTL